MWLIVGSIVATFLSFGFGFLIGAHVMDRAIVRNIAEANGLDWETADDITFGDYPIIPWGRDK